MQYIDPFEAAFVEQEDSPPESPVAANDIETQIGDASVDVNPPEDEGVDVINHPNIPSTSGSPLAPTRTSQPNNKAKDEDEEEDEENMEVELGKFPASGDPDKMAKMQSILCQFTEEQMSRYESFRRSGFQKSNMKRLLVSVTGSQKISVPMTIVVSGIAKMFVGEIVETAKVVMTERKDCGPIRPCHIREAYRRLKLEGRIPRTPVPSQRSGKLPPSQRLTWRKDSALRDGLQIGVDLVGGYYDAGDNVKFNFPMAFTTTMLAWSVIEFGSGMGTSELQHAREAIQWATDYFLKCTSIPGFVFVQVGDAFADHNCWERPEDMDTPRTPYAVTKYFPGSEVSAEIAAALAASSVALRPFDRTYLAALLSRAKTVFNFADKYRGSYNDSLGPWVCSFYCDFSGYKDELIWAAAWLHKATKSFFYLNYVKTNIQTLDAGFAEFGWDSKHAGINVLLSQLVFKNVTEPSSIIVNADKFICSVLPESPTKLVSYSPGGLVFKNGGSNMQHSTALSFLLLVYAHYSNREIHCGDVVIQNTRLVEIAKSQVDYILGENPLGMSYMVGYGKKYPERIHHRGSSLPSMEEHPQRIECQGGNAHFFSSNPNPNVAVGAVVGGPDMQDRYDDSRSDFPHSEPTTYINAPLIGVLAYFKHRSYL